MMDGQEPTLREKYEAARIKTIMDQAGCSEQKARSILHGTYVDVFHGGKPEVGGLTLEEQMRENGELP